MIDATWVVLCIIASILGGLLYHNAHKRGVYEEFGSVRKCVAVLAIHLTVYTFIFVPYFLWQANGLHPIDATNAERIMVEKYLSQGVGKADAHFIVSSRSSLKGFVELIYTDGSRLTVKCEGTKGEGSNILITCNA